MARVKYRVKSIVMSIKMPLSLVEEIDKMVERGLYQNRSDFVREAVRRLITEYKRQERRSHVIGVR